MKFNFLVARPWLFLAIFALGVSALLAVLLVLSRAPHVQELFGLKAWFHTILVLHVNFAVLVWLLSFIGFIWVGCTQSINRYAIRSAWALGCLGALLMLLSPFIGDVKPVMSNYVPIIDSAVFFTGLVLFAIAISTLAWMVVQQHAWGVLKASALMWFMALLTVFVHLVTLERLEPVLFFESLFWGGGHVLQFVYVLILWLIWSWPAFKPLVAQLKSVAILLGLSLIFIMAFQVGSELSRQVYTVLMQLGMLALLLPMLGWWYQNKSKNVMENIRISVSSSVLLILLGVIIGLFIRDDSVIVTSHYHATNAAITVAFMGLIYGLVQQWSSYALAVKWTKFQIVLYTVGMVLYVLGMAGSGWLGVPRKTAMILEDNSWERISMGVMGVGGTLSIIATLLFVGHILYVCIRLNKAHKEGVK